MDEFQPDQHLLCACSFPERRPLGILAPSSVGNHDPYFHLPRVLPTDTVALGLAYDSLKQRDIQPCLSEFRPPGDDCHATLFCL